MTEKVNYEDNLFFLSQMIGTAEKGLSLNLDRTLFYKTQARQLRFIDKTLQHIFQDLSENSYLINRKQYLHSLMKKKNRFVSLLDSFLNPRREEWQPTPEDRQILRRALEIHKSDIGDIREILSISDSRDEGRDIISRDEMNFLMAPGLLAEDPDE